MSKASKAHELETEWIAARLDAVQALRDVLKRGGNQDRVAASRLILDRTDPAPKSATVQVLNAVGASDGGRVAALGKVSARSLLTGPEPTDATFTPLPRVQTDE